MKMSLVECKNRAQDEGYNTATFDLCGILGRKKCKWLDAYMGLFQFEGNDGFVMTNDVKHMNVWCENFSANGPESA